MLSPFYRTFAQDPVHLSEWTKSMLYVIEYTVTTGNLNLTNKILNFIKTLIMNLGKDGGRGSFFKNLITERCVRHIQETLSSVLYRFIKLTSTESNQDELIGEIYKENRPFAMKEFYKKVVSFPEGTNQFVLQDHNIGPQITDWLKETFEDTASIIDVNTNLFSPDWSQDLFGSKFSSMSSAWEMKDIGLQFRLSNHAPSQLKKMIEDGIKSQGKTCYLLLAVYKELGFIMDNSCDITFSIYDVIGPRLEAFCRLYLGTVLSYYFAINTSKVYTKRPNLISSFTKKGVFLLRGNLNATKLAVKANRSQSGIYIIVIV